MMTMEVLKTGGAQSIYASGRVAGGLFNTGTVTLVQSLLSGNTAPVIGPEAYSFSGIIVGERFNVFGHDGFSGAAGFTLGATDLGPAGPLSAILEPTLGYNGGPTKTHTLVFGSPHRQQYAAHDQQEERHDPAQTTEMRTGER